MEFYGENKERLKAFRLAPACCRVSMQNAEEEREVRHVRGWGGSPKSWRAAGETGPSCLREQETLGGRA